MTFPTVIVLRRTPDWRDEKALHSALQQAISPEVASTLHFMGEISRVTYYEWKMRDFVCHIGQCSAPFRDVGGTFDAATGQMIESHDRDPGMPDDPALRAAWEAHSSWVYVDVLEPSSACPPPLFRLAAHLLDDDCLLVWDYGGIRPLRGPMSLITPVARASLAAGKWPA